jgi:hypothetical protein
MNIFNSSKMIPSQEIIVRLATGIKVRTPKRTINMELSLGTFNETDEFTVLKLDNKFDILLGICWCARHEPEVDWKNQQEHIDILQVSTGLLHDFLKLGFSPVIVIDTFSGDKINKYLETLYELDKDLSIKIFGLFTTDEELKRRLDLRTNPEFKDFPICKRLNDDVIKWKHKSEFQVDTTGLSPTQTAEKIYGQINSEKNASR